MKNYIKIIMETITYLLPWVLYPFLAWLLNKIPVDWDFGKPDSPLFVIGWIFAPITNVFLIIAILIKLMVMVFNFII